MQNQQDSPQKVVFDFQSENNYLQSIRKGTSSEPTKKKVGAFKRRVVKLIKLYIAHSGTLNHILDSVNQEIFLGQPDMMNQIIEELLNKQGNLDKVRLYKLLNVYKIVLLYKPRNSSTYKLSETFLRLLKKLLNDGGQNIVVEMVVIAFTKRSCRLGVGFFQYLIRKIPASKKFILEACEKVMRDGKKIRGAQMKQLEKLKNGILKRKGNFGKREDKVGV